MPATQAPFSPQQQALLALQRLYGQSQPSRNQALDYQQQLLDLYATDPVSDAQRALLNLYQPPPRRNELMYLVGF